MLKCASVYTLEMDSPELALEGIKAQLKEKITLLEHTAGIVMCHPEYVASGVLKYVCEHLPFDLAGVTTASQAVNDGMGELMLTIFVMTSDDVRFVTGVTESVAEGIDGPVTSALQRAVGGAGGAAGGPAPGAKPELAIIFPPFLFGPAGDEYVDVVERNLPGAAIFGTLATDDSATFSDCETIYNGMNYTSSMAFMLCYGEIHPRFMIAALPPDPAILYRGEITRASGTRIYEINHMNVYDYYNSLDFIDVTQEEKSMTLFTPLMVDLKKRSDYDGVPVVRGHISFAEDGAAIYTGEVDEGSTFVFSVCNYETILSTATQTIEGINDLEGINGVLLFPCIVRRMALFGVDPLGELQAAKDIIRPDVPYMMGYSGGEICPTSIRGGVPTNRFHNYSLVILVI